MRPSGAGFTALRNALAIKFDTWFNPESNEPNKGHIAIHSGGRGAATADVSHALGLAHPVPELTDGAYHTARVIYEPRLGADDGPAVIGASSPTNNAWLANTLRPSTAVLGDEASDSDSSEARGSARAEGGYGLLRVLVDEREALTLPIDLSALLDLDEGGAYVGFTGSTGLAFQEHKVVRWEFTAADAAEGESRTRKVVYK